MKIDYFVLNQPKVLKLNMQNVNISFDNFFKGVNTVLDKHVQYQKVKKYTLIFKAKPQIIADIQNSIEIKNTFFTLKQK